jgi:hypothetical protein
MASRTESVTFMTIPMEVWLYASERNLWLQVAGPLRAGVTWPFKRLKSSESGRSRKRMRGPAGPLYKNAQVWRSDLQTFRGTAAVVAALVFFGAIFVTETALASNVSCYWALNSACGRVSPAGAHVRACIETHHSRLSRSCGGRLPRFVAVTRRCEAEARRFCSHVTRASAVPSCMNRRLAEVGASCRKALAKVGVR